MRATFHTMETARRALFTAQTQLEVTSHNIANVNTEGYTRQRGVQQATAPAEQPFLWETQGSKSVGSGVDITQIEALRDRYLQAQILREESRFGKADVRSDILLQVETIFNEPNDATLRAQMDRFWASMQDVTQDSGSLALRANLRTESQALTDMFNDISSRLKNLQGTPESVFQGSIKDQIEVEVKELNKKGREISILNVKIESMETAGFNANDLRDRRDKLVEEISATVNVERILSPTNGQLSLRVGHHQLVQHGEFREVYFKQKSIDGPGIIVGARSALSGQSIDPGYPEYSESPDVASAELTGEVDLRNNLLVVTQLAQTNEKFSFLSFNPNKNSLASFGVKSGTFTLNGREYEIDAANTSVEKFVDFINSLDAGVNAKLNEAGQVIFKSQFSGAQGQIQFSDGTSNLALIMNMTDSVVGQNAIFNFGRQDYESATNKVKNQVPGVILELKSRGTAQLDLRPIVTSGKLKGLMEVKQGNIDDILDRLDELAYRLTQEVNFLHQGGFGLDGKTGRNFFTPFKIESDFSPWRNAAEKIDLSIEFKADLNVLAASKGVYNLPSDPLKVAAGAGNADNLLAMAQIRYKNVFNNGQSNFDDFYDEIVSTYGTSSSDAEQILSYENQVREQLQKKRDSVSGVSIDEELANTIKFQQSYNAAARLIQMVDELLDVIIRGV